MYLAHGGESSHCILWLPQKLRTSAMPSSAADLMLDASLIFFAPATFLPPWKMRTFTSRDDESASLFTNSVECVNGCFVSTENLEPCLERTRGS